jgi:hypothetical protein
MEKMLPLSKPVWEIWSDASKEVQNEHRRIFDIWERRVEGLPRALFQLNEASGDKFKFFMFKDSIATNLVLEGGLAQEADKDTCLCIFNSEEGSLYFAYKGREGSDRFEYYQLDDVIYRLAEMTNQRAPSSQREAAPSDYSF